jgi:transcriptional regulator with PAS, ATPase and Fis domain
VVEELRRELSSSIEVGEMVTRSSSMEKILKILPQVAESDSTVLLEGETGTGKEVMARSLHNLSSRKDEPFIAINCGALPDTLLESELFGYKAGAFTSADRDKPGLFEAAGRGTILLDEIGDTSSAFQIRLLRILEEKEYQPLGSVEKFSTDTRIIAATNRDLEKMVKDGTFRRDLFYRINIIRFDLPPLRKRIEDLPLLVERFITKMNHIKGRSVTSISIEAMALLLQHDYPGNIRELENIIEHGFVLCREGDLEVAHLPAYLLKVDGPPALDHVTIEDSLRTTEEASIVDALRRNKYNRLAAAKDLGIHKSTLFRKIKKYDISLPDHDGRSSTGRH